MSEDACGEKLLPQSDPVNPAGDVLLRVPPVDEFLGHDHTGEGTQTHTLLPAGQVTGKGDRSRFKGHETVGHMIGHVIAKYHVTIRDKFMEKNLSFQRLVRK